VPVPSSGFHRRGRRFGHEGMLVGVMRTHPVHACAPFRTCRCRLDRTCEESGQTAGGEKDTTRSVPPRLLAGIWRGSASEQLLTTPPNQIGTEFAVHNTNAGSIHLAVVFRATNHDENWNSKQLHAELGAKINCKSWRLLPSVDPQSGEVPI
jgi:hypothetical protein